MSEGVPSGSEISRQHPGFAEAFRFWLKLGFSSFGGPAGQIAVMHRELVERRRWISEDHFLHALNFCMLLPGPEAQQLATYLGWRLHGARGGVAAGALFVLPSVFILFGLSWLYMAGGSLPWLAGIFHGLLGAVLAVVLEAVLRIGGKTLKSASLWAVAALSFVLIYFFQISFVLTVLGALGHGRYPRQFPAGKKHGAAGPAEAAEDRPVLVLPPVPVRSWRRDLRVTGICLALWWLPVFGVAAWLGWDSTHAQQGLFFSKAALVTLGGAYAVLPYVAQQAVETHGWLTHPPDDGRLGPGGNHPRPAHHGASIRGICGCLAVSRNLVPFGLGGPGRSDYYMGHFPAVLSFCLPGRSARGEIRCSAAPQRVPDGHHRVRGGRHFEPGGQIQPSRLVATR